MHIQSEQAGYMVVTGLFLVDRHVQLEQALLLYFASQHEAAVQELQLYKDQLDTASVEQEQLGIVMTRLRFMQQSV